MMVKIMIFGGDKKLEAEIRNLVLERNSSSLVRVRFPSVIFCSCKPRCQIFCATNLDKPDEQDIIWVHTSISFFFLPPCRIKGNQI